jgi:peptide-methionine (S)-S-oxide reductase
MFAFMKKMTQLLPAGSTVPGRKEKTPVPETHFVNGARIVPPFAQGLEIAQFAPGCLLPKPRRRFSPEASWRRGSGNRAPLPSCP